MGLGREAWQEVRKAIIDILREDNKAMSSNAEAQQEILVPMV